jgi:hypothetical protein
VARVERSDESRAGRLLRLHPGTGRLEGHSERWDRFPDTTASSLNRDRCRRSSIE